MTGALDTAHLVVITQVDRDEINNEWIVARTGREVYRVKIASAEAPPSLLVPAPDVAELLGQGREHDSWRGNRKLCLASRYAAVTQGGHTRPLVFHMPQYRPPKPTLHCGVT